MYRIAVCDDEKLFAESLADCIKGYMDGQRFSYCVDTFYNVVDLDEALQNRRYDLLFLDILIKNDSGMQFAKELRERGDEISIVFVSSNTDYALEAFTVFPITFLPKPIVRKDVQTVMEKMFSQYLKKPTAIINDKLNGRTVIQYENICYLESQGHDIVMQCCNRETLRFGGVFSEFVSELPEAYFFKCHRSYAVNMRYVQRLQNCRFIMSDGSIIPIAKPLYKTAQERFASMIE